MPHRYTFDNTLEYMNLSGCVIQKASRLGDTVTLNFNYLNILPEHPFSRSSRRQITDQAVLKFDNCSISECRLFAESNTRGLPPEDISEEEFFFAHLAPGFTVLHADSFLSEKNFAFQFFGNVSKENGGHYASFSLSFDREVAHWNELFSNFQLIK